MFRVACFVCGIVPRVNMTLEIVINAGALCLFLTTFEYELIIVRGASPPGVPFSNIMRFRNNLSAENYIEKHKGRVVCWLMKV
jgi:hypothetical protein